MTMNRDTDLVRDLLVRARDPDHLSFEGDKPAAEHAAYLMDRDYLDGAYLRDDDGALSFIDVRGLTARGIALLVAIQEDAVWMRTKKLLAASLDRISLEGIRAMAEVVGRQMV